MFGQLAAYYTSLWAGYSGGSERTVSLGDRSMEKYTLRQPEFHSKKAQGKKFKPIGSKNIAKKKRKIGSLAHAPGRSVLETREQMATSVRKTEYGEQPGEDNN